MCPYHAWTYDLSGRLKGAPGFREVESFEPADHGLVELPLDGVERLGVRPRAAPAGLAAGAGRSSGTSATWRGCSRRTASATLVVADRHTYEVAANWKVIAENYHECYHCPLIHPELCEVTPPDSGDNYDLPGASIGGSMVLRDGMADDVAGRHARRDAAAGRDRRPRWSTSTCCRTCWSPRTPTT